MNRFELFSMIYYVLDSVWEDGKDEELGQYLSGMNPFLFLDSDSADPAVYADFKKMIPERIDIKDSYDLAENYVESLKSRKIQNAFQSISEEEWFEEVEAYLSEPHKN